MNKTELISAMAEKSGLTRADAKKALDAFVVTVEDVLKTGGKVGVVGFGTYSVYERKERIGINPSTKKAITIVAKKVVKFKPGSGLSSAIE